MKNEEEDEKEDKNQFYTGNRRFPCTNPPSTGKYMN